MLDFLCFCWEIKIKIKWNKTFHSHKLIVNLHTHIKVTFNYNVCIYLCWWHFFPAIRELELILLQLYLPHYEWTWRLKAPNAECKSLSLAAVVKETLPWLMPIYKQKYGGTLPPVRGNTVVYGRRMERKLHFSSRSPLFALPLHTLHNREHM